MARTLLNMYSFNHDWSCEGGTIDSSSGNEEAEAHTGSETGIRSYTCKAAEMESEFRIARFQSSCT